MQSNNVFRDVSLLSDGYEPEEVRYRDRQIDQLLACIASFLQSRQQNTVLVYGPPGSGKTLTVIKVLRAVPEIHTVYVNCAEVNTKYRIFARIAEQCGEEVPFTGLPTDMIVERAVDALKGFPAVALVLDEVDYLFKSPHRMLDIRDVIYILTRTQDLKLLLIGISNTLGFLEFLDTRTRSSLKHQEVHFPPYSRDELLEILWQRVSAAFAPGVVSRGVFEKCIEEAARVTRDIRSVTSYFRRAGELMMRMGESVLTLSIFNQAMQEVAQEEAERLIFGLPKQQLLALAAIDSVLADEEEATTGEVYEQYTHLCEERRVKPVTMRRFHDYLQELAENSLICVRTISRGRYGRTSKITRGNFTIPRKILNNVLFNSDAQNKSSIDISLLEEEFSMLQLLYTTSTRGEAVDDAELIPPERRTLRRLEDKGLAKCIITAGNGTRTARWVITEKGKSIIEAN